MALHHARKAVVDGVRDSLFLLRRRPVGVLIGSFGYMGFDIAALVFCFRAFGHTPALPIIVVAYIIGPLGGLVPLPGGIGGTEGGLIGLLALYQRRRTCATRPGWRRPPAQVRSAARARDRSPRTPIRS